MVKREDIESKTEELVTPFCDEMGYELVDVDFVKEGSEYYLRIYIDKPGGVTIDDCETLSRAYNDVLDEAQYIDQAYIFEVSSPGLTRPLKKEKDYIRNKGKLVDVKLFKKLEGRTEFCATLKDYKDGEFTLVPEDMQDEKELLIPVKDVALIKLSFVQEKA